MASTAILAIKIISDATQAAKDLQVLEQKTGRFQAGMDKAGRVANRALLGIGAGAAGAALKAEALTSAQAGLTQVMSQMGNAVHTDRLIEYADAQEKLLGIDEKTILATQTKLATFSELAKTTGEVGGAFDRATAAAIDLAAAGFGSAESNAVQLGKALQDPVKGISALTRVGVTFTESEKKKIAALVKSGDAAKAQGMILGALEKQVGGVAKANADDSAKMALAWGEVVEVLGSALLPVMAAVTPYIVDMAKYVQEHSTAVLIGVGVVAGFAVAIKVVQAAIVAYHVVMKVITAATIVWKNVQLAFNLAMMANPVGLVIVAIVALIAVIVVAYKKSETFRNIVQAVMRAASTAVGWLIEKIGALIGWVGDKAVAGWNKFKAGAVKVLEIVTAPTRTLIEVVRNLVEMVRDKLVGAWNKVDEKLGPILSRIKTWFDNLLTPIQTILDKVKDLIDWIGRIDFPDVPGWVPGFRAAPPTGGAGAGRGPAPVVVKVSGALDPDSVARQIQGLLNGRATRLGVAAAGRWS